MKIRNSLGVVLFQLLAVGQTLANNCDGEERNALAVSDTRPDLRAFQDGNIRSMDTGNLTQRLEVAKTRAAELPAAALFACLADRELRVRASAPVRSPDDAKTTGRGARSG
jgi:hypothetical protein